MAPDQFLGGVALVRGEVRGAHLFCQKRGDFTHSNDRKNVPLSNVEIVEMAGGLTVNEEAKQG